MMPPNTGSTVIVFLILNSQFPQRKKQKTNIQNVLYLISTPLTKVFFLVPQIGQEAMVLEQEHIESEEAEEESRRFKGNVS